MEIVILVESFSKIKTIQILLDNTVSVEATGGHICNLPSKQLGIDVNNNFKPTYELLSCKSKIISNLKNKTKGKEVYFAGDPDREGEFIAWRLAELLSEFGDIQRITFNEITETAIKEALQAAGTVDMNLVDAAKVRRFMDRLIGYRTSRFARSWSLSSMGRVQTPTLGFVVKREKEIQKFIQTPYWAVQAIASGIDFRVRFHDKLSLRQI